MSDEKKVPDEELDNVSGGVRGERELTPRSPEPTAGHGPPRPTNPPIEIDPP